MTDSAGERVPFVVVLSGPCCTLMFKYLIVVVDAQLLRRGDSARGLSPSVAVFLPRRLTSRPPFYYSSPRKSAAFQSEGCGLRSGA